MNQAAETETITRDQWNLFLAQFTRENRGTHGRLTILSDEGGYQVETEDRPFEGVAADVKDGENLVWITFGSTADDHLAHGIHGVTVIRALAAADGDGSVVEVESKDGTKTLLELSRPGAFALPPASQS